MFFVAPFIFGIILAAALIFSSCLIKVFVKMEGFAGFCSGVCCSILIGIMTSIYGTVIMLIFGSDLTSAASSATSSPTSVNPSEVVGLAKGTAFILWLLIAGLYVIQFVFIFLFTKRISKPESQFDSVLMFNSGFVLLPSIFFFLIWLIYVAIMNAAIDKLINDQMTEKEREDAITRQLGMLGSAIFTIVEFIFFFYMLSFSGTIIMCMIHHRKLNSFIIWVNIACFFGPLLLWLLFLLTWKVGFIEYPIILPTLASFGLGIFFYMKYSDETTRGEPLNNQQNYELSN